MTNTKAIEWLKDGNLLYTLKQNGWKKGEPVMVNSSMIRIEGDDKDAITDRVIQALKTQEQLENGYVMVRDVNVVSVNCPCGNTIQVNKALGGKDE